MKGKSRKRSQFQSSTLMERISDEKHDVITKVLLLTVVIMHTRASTHTHTYYPFTGSIRTTLVC